MDPLAWLAGIVTDRKMAFFVADTFAGGEGFASLKLAMGTNGLLKFGIAFALNEEVDWETRLRPLLPEVVS